MNSAIYLKKTFEIILSFSSKTATEILEIEHPCITTNKLQRPQENADD